jgi:hypothetical protein
MAQQNQGIVRLRGAMVEFYPVEMNGWDMLGVLITVLCVGILFSTVLVRGLLKRHAV